MNRVPQLSPGPAAIPSATVASSTLECWQWAVRRVPVTASSDEARIALRGLAAWYARICVDDTYDSPAPSEGLDALTAQARGPDRLLLQRDVVSHWAVRVAQELAGSRRALASDCDPAATLSCTRQARPRPSGRVRPVVLIQPAPWGPVGPRWAPRRSVDFCGERPIGVVLQHLGPRAPGARTRRDEGAAPVEQTVRVVEADGFAVLDALEKPPPVIAKPVFEVDSADQVCIAAAIGLAATPSPA